MNLISSERNIYNENLMHQLPEPGVTTGTDGYRRMPSGPNAFGACRIRRIFIPFRCEIFPAV